MVLKRCKCGNEIKSTGETCLDCSSDVWGHCSKNTYDEKRQTGLNAPVGNLEIDTRILNALEAGRVNTVFDLMKKTDEQLLGMRGIGPLYVREIRQTLDALNVELPPDV